MSWQAGDAIVRRDVWHGRPPDLLALYMPQGSPLRFAPDFFGAPHPWRYTDRWRGHGVLQLQRPGEMHSVWVFWEGEDRAFAGWYINLQEPFRRTPLGVDTQDLELDIVLPPDGRGDTRTTSRWSAGSSADAGRPRRSRPFGAKANRIGRQLESGRRWWQDEWMSWEPDPQWPQPTLPAAWDRL